MDISTQPDFPEIRTSRFLMRRIVQSDIESVFAGLSDPLVIANYGVSYDTLEATQIQMDWFNEIYDTGTGIWWGICEPLDPSRLIGAVGLNDISHMNHRAELGYWLFPAYWGRGIATECVSSMLTYAFCTLRMHRIGAEVDIDNLGSSRLLERLGFHHEGIRRGYEIKNGTHLDIMCFSRLSTDVELQT